MLDFGPLVTSAFIAGDATLQQRQYTATPVPSSAILRERRLNRASRDWHNQIVTLSEVKGLAVRFFVPLRMTPLRDYSVKCTNVLNSDLELPIT
jgi:hypothetical protein